MPNHGNVVVHFIEMTQSKKHHYIPRFYLNGFTNPDGSFFVYDKKKDEIRKSTPDNTFYEKYRNTGLIGDEKLDLPEQILAYFDGRTADVLDKIRTAKFDEHVLTPENLYIIRFFIATTFWRIPKNDKLRENTIDKFSFKDLGFGIFNTETGVRNVESENILKNVDVFRKMYTSLLPIVSFMNKYDTGNPSEWNLVHRTNSSHITGDNPIISKETFNDFSAIHKDLIMPLSANRIILCTNKKVPETFQPEFNLKMDIIILHQSERFVCSSNENYLRLIVEKLYKTSVGKGWENKMIEDIFGYFK